MAFLHSNSCECVKSELDLFTLPPTQTSIEHGDWVQYKPLASLTDDSPIEFVVPGHGDEYIDLSHTILNMQVKIVKSDGTKLEDDVKVGPVNNWLHSLFSQVDVYLNQRLVSSAGNTYAYRSYIETLLNYGPAAKGSHLTSSLWYNDAAGSMDNTEDGNEGLVKRRSFTAKSAPIDLLGHIHSDIFNQEKFLLNGVELRVRLIRSKDAFSLLSKDSTYKVNIVEANLFVRRVRINPAVLLAHSKTLTITTAKYPITKVEVKNVTIPAGVQGKTLDNIFLGQLPKRVIVGFITNGAFIGNYKKNPFNFQHFSLNFFSLYIDGRQVPSKPIQPDYVTNNQFVRSYHTVFSGTGMHFMNDGNNIPREHYAQGNCLMAFDLTPDLSANTLSHWNLVRHGSLRIEIRFDTALAETVNCLVYGEFDNVIEIDKDRNVIVDFGN